MKIINFLNEKELLKILETNPQQFKLNKSKFIKLPKLNDTNKIAIEKPFKDTSICAIAIIDDLFVIDCDNVYSFNYILSNINRLGQKTLITKSPYGGHFYFKTKESLNLKHIKPNLKDVDDLENPLEYYTSSTQLNIEFYDKNSSKGLPRMMFDGANNSYYKIISETTEPQEILEDVRIFLLDLASSYKDDFSTKSYLSCEGKLFMPNAYKGSFVKRIVDKANENKPLTEDDVFLFKSLYEKTDRNIVLPIQKGQRNSSLWSIASWAASSCYIKDEAMWCLFVETINNSPLFMSEAIEAEELYKTILKKGKFQTHYYTLDEMYEKQNTLNLMKFENTQKFNPNNCKRFLAYNINSKAASEDILLVDLSTTNFLEVRYIRNEEAALRECRNYPDLYSQHVEVVSTKNGDKEVINIDNLPRLEIDESDYSISSRAFTKKDNTWTLHTSFFLFNSDISKILMDPSNPDNHITKEEFEATPFFKILSKNLFPNEIIRLKFLNDLRTFLITKRGLQTMATIIDVQGSTGKDSILLNYLSHLIYGLHKKEEVILSNSIMYRKPTMEAKNPTLTDIIESQFNEDFASCLVGITEDGQNPDIEKFCNKMQSVIKSPKIRIHRKFKEAYSTSNHLFIFRGTNSRSKPFTDGTNTRYYVSIAERHYKLGEDECELELFPNGREWQLKNDYYTILKFLLLNDEYFKDALKYSELPDLPLNELIEDEVSNEELDDLVDSPVSPYNKIRDILDALVPNRDSLNIPLLESILNQKSHILYDVASTIATLYYLKFTSFYPKEEFNQNIYKHVIFHDKNKTIGLTRYPTVSNFSKLLNNIKGIGKVTNKVEKSKLLTIICLKFTDGSRGGSTRLKYFGKIYST